MGTSDRQRTRTRRQKGISGAGRRSVGKVAWTDLTIPNATELRDFYQSVVGWKAVAVDMGGYLDFSMKAPASGRIVAGICHARGPNADLPPQWLVYLTVQNLKTSMARCIERGGRVVAEPRSCGVQGRYCVIRDPAGAFAALLEPPR